MDITNNLKTLCKIRSISFADLANRLQVSRQSLNNTAKHPGADSTDRMAAALNVPVWVLFHPDPAAALEAQTASEASQTSPATWKTICPRCKRPIFATLTAANLLRLEARQDEF